MSKVLNRQGSSGLVERNNRRGGPMPLSSWLLHRFSAPATRMAFCALGVMVMAYSTTSILFSDFDYADLSFLQQDSRIATAADGSSHRHQPAKSELSLPEIIRSIKANSTDFSLLEDRTHRNTMLQSLMEKMTTFQQHYPSDPLDLSNSNIQLTNHLPDGTNKRNVEWHWYNFSASTTSRETNKNGPPPSRKLLIVQHTGWDDYYYNMTDISSITNMAYAQKHGLDYVRLNGVYYGSHQGAEATYNKMYILKTLHQANQRARKEYEQQPKQQSTSGDNQQPPLSSPPNQFDAVLLLDSDALIVDLDGQVLELLPENILIAAHKVHTKDNSTTHEINAGVMMWNLQHDHLMNVVQKWEAICLDKIQKGRGVSDQRPLQGVLRDSFSEAQRREWGIVNAINTTHFRYSKGTFVRHFLRQKRPKNWATQKNVAYFVPTTDRVDRLTKEVLKVCYYQWPGACVFVDPHKVRYREATLK